MSPARTPSRFGSTDGAIDVFSRNCSLAVTSAGWFRPGTPVRKIVARSWRLSVGIWLRPQTFFSRKASSGLSTNGSAAASCVGSIALNVSFTWYGMTASLTSG